MAKILTQFSTPKTAQIKTKNFWPLSILENMDRKTGDYIRLEMQSEKYYNFL